MKDRLKGATPVYSTSPDRIARDDTQQQRKLKTQRRDLQAMPSKITKGLQQLDRLSVIRAWYGLRSSNDDVLGRGSKDNKMAH